LKLLRLRRNLPLQHRMSLRMFLSRLLKNR
jgi:hypothetical protein